jgi:hypothetical protein
MTNGEPVKRSKGYIELIGQALVDGEIREQLLTAPEKLAAEYNLSDSELQTLRSMDRTKLEEAASKLGGETTALIEIVVHGTFDKAP